MGSQKLDMTERLSTGWWLKMILELMFLCLLENLNMVACLLIISSFL